MYFSMHVEILFQFLRSRFRASCPLPIAYCLLPADFNCIATISIKNGAVIPHGNPRSNKLFEYTG